MSFKFKVKKHVTLPLFKLANNEPNYLRFDGEIFTGKVVDDKKEPPKMANVTDLQTGEVGQIILGQVLLESLHAAYPEHSYVGKSYEVVKHAPEGARKYSLWNITEIEVDTSSPEPVVQDAAAAPAPAKKGK